MGRIRRAVESTTGYANAIMAQFCEGGVRLKGIATVTPQNMPPLLVAALHKMGAPGDFSFQVQLDTVVKLEDPEPTSGEGQTQESEV